VTKETRGASRESTRTRWAALTNGNKGLEGERKGRKSKRKRMYKGKSEIVVGARKEGGSRVGIERGNSRIYFLLDGTKVFEKWGSTQKQKKTKKESCHKVNCKEERAENTKGNLTLFRTTANLHIGGVGR